MNDKVDNYRAVKVIVGEQGDLAPLFASGPAGGIMSGRTTSSRLGRPTASRLA